MRRRRYDSWHEWDRPARWFIVRDAPVSRAEQRRALLQLAKYMALVWIGCAILFYAWSVRFDPPFDVRSPAGWVKGITTGVPGERAAALVALSESDLLPRSSGRVLGDQLRESMGVREAAVFTLIKVVRGGRCLGVVVNALGGAPTVEVREAAARILAGAGPALRGVAVGPLVRALRSDSSLRAAAATALVAMGDSSEFVERALERGLAESRGAARASVLEALAELFPSRPSDTNSHDRQPPRR